MAEHESTPQAALASSKPPPRFPLPPELVFYIIKLFSGSRLELGQLALISHAWTYPAQSFLFHTFYFVPLNHSIERTLNKFAETVPTTIACLVRKVFVGFGTRSVPANLSSLPEVNLTLLGRALQRLPSLQALTLSRCWLNDTTGNDILPLPFVQKPLAKLVLVRVGGTPEFFDRVFSGFPVYDTLVATELSMFGGLLDQPDWEDWVVSCHSQTSQVRVLFADLFIDRRGHPCNTILYKSLLSLPTHLTSLDVGSLCLIPGLWDVTQDAIRERGRFLTRLRLDILSITEPFPLPDARYLNLAEYCPFLQVLHLYINAYTAPIIPEFIACNKSQFSNARLILSGAPRESLQTFILGCFFDERARGVGSLERAEAELLLFDEILTQFSGLREARIQSEIGHAPRDYDPGVVHRGLWRAISTPTDVREYLEQCFAKTRARGILAQT